METMKAKLVEWSKNRQLVRAATVAGGVLLALVLVTCISIHMRAHIQRQYASAAEYMQEQTYQQMIEMTQLFARVDEPNVDVQHKLIPSLREKYAAVTALNDALTNGFGRRYAVLGEEQLQAFEAAFEEYSSAYRTGMATGLARDDMAECIAGVQAMIDERYKPDEEDIIGTLVTANTPAEE